jgi:tRNA A37 N6-isopentenylltransferase MiaA
LRARICRASNTKPQQLRRFAVDRLKDRNIVSRHYDELESELQGKCKKLEETFQRVATNTIGYTRKQAYIEWFDEECAKVNEEKTPPESEPSKTKPKETKKLTN